MNMLSAPVLTPSANHAELDRLGDEIAELSAHLEAATARLLDLIREFDAREGWGNGFRSCAHWLSWRVGLDMGAAREKGRGAQKRPPPRRLQMALPRWSSSRPTRRRCPRGRPPLTASHPAPPAG